MKQKKIYICGTLNTDIPARENYLAAEAFLASKGYLVLNPGILPEELGLEDLTKIRMAMLSCADAVVILRKDEQMEKTDARRMEAMYAACLGIKLYSCLESVE